MQNYDACFARLKEINDLKDGWFDGDGIGINVSTYNSALHIIDNLCVQDCEPPRLYPDPDAGWVHFEWNGKHRTTDVDCVIEMQTSGDRIEFLAVATDQPIKTLFEINFEESYFNLFMPLITAILKDFDFTKDLNR